MGNYPHSAQDFANAETRTFGNVTDSWLTAYNYEAHGGQIIHTRYRGHMKLVKIYADGGRMYGLKSDKTKIWLSDEQGRPYPDSVNRVKGVEGYGTGPMMLISGTIENPQYHMKIGSSLSPDWSWAQINSFHDIENAMSMNKGSFRIHNLAKQDYDAKHLGTASRNLFLDLKPGDINSWAHEFNKSVDTIGSQLILGAAEAVADEFVPFASTIFQMSGGEAAAQQALDNFVNKKYSSTTASMWERERTTKLDPWFSSQIHDARINERIDQLQPYLTKYGGPNIDHIKKIESKKFRIESIIGYTTFVTRWHVNEQMDAIETQIKAARKTLGTQDVDLTFFRKGWKDAKEEERISLLNNYKKQFVKTVLPALEEHQRVWGSRQIRETQDIKEDVIEKQLDEARKVMGSQDQNLAFTKGWKDANVEERKLLLTKYEKRYKYTVAPRLHAKLSGIKTDFESAAQTDLKYRDKFGRAQQSMIIGRTLIMGDVVKHQKGASSKQNMVRG